MLQKVIVGIFICHTVDRIPQYQPDGGCGKLRAMLRFIYAAYTSSVTSTNWPRTHIFFLPASTLCTSVPSEFREEIQADGGPLQCSWPVLPGNNRNLHFPTKEKRAHLSAHALVCWLLPDNRQGPGKRKKAVERKTAAIPLRTAAVAKCCFGFLWGGQAPGFFLFGSMCYPLTGIS